MHSRILAAAVAIGAPFASRAAAPGPEIAFRTGFALPFGNFASGSSSLSDAFTGFIPLGAELAWRFAPELSAGATFSYGVGLPTNCPTNSSCSGHDVGLGFEMRYHAMPHASADPWVALGVGYEWLSLSETSGGTTVDGGFDGFEYIHAQFGLDFRRSGAFGFGPFIQIGLGEYKGANASSGGTSFSTDINNKAVHGFVTLGFRASFLP